MSFFSLTNVSKSISAQLEKNTDKDGKEAKLGDLIEIFCGPYSHWAVYIGNGYVVHFSAPNSSLASKIDGVPGIVTKEKLRDVVGKDSWRVNNSLDKKYKPLPPNEIVKKACSLVGVPLIYYLKTDNCEHFATEMRYGKAESRQVQDVKNEVIFEGLMASAGAIIAGAAFILGLHRS